jgi:uncharacterized protein YdiU (UPF0061 family)
MVRVGFTHGVMNTDNIALLAIQLITTSFLDEYNLNFTPNTTDLPKKKLCFGKQANIAHGI